MVEVGVERAIEVDFGGVGECDGIMGGKNDVDVDSATDGDRDVA